MYIMDFNAKSARGEQKILQVECDERFSTGNKITCSTQDITSWSQDPA